MRDYHVFTDTGHGSDVRQLQAPGRSDLLWTFAEFVNLQREMRQQADGLRETLKKDEDGIAYLWTASGMIRVWCKFADTDYPETRGRTAPENRKARKTKTTYQRALHPRNPQPVLPEHRERRIVEQDTRPRNEHQGWWKK